MAKSNKKIPVQPETREKLFQEKRGPNDTYDSVINRLLDQDE